MQFIKGKSSLKLRRETVYEIFFVSQNFKIILSL
jgi:hypothetical protein